jgi:hypothetical protein
MPQEENGNEFLSLDTKDLPTSSVSKLRVAAWEGMRAIGPTNNPTRGGSSSIACQSSVVFSSPSDVSD